MDVENIVHLCNRVLLSHLKKTMNFAGKWVELKKNILSEVDPDPEIQI